MTTERKPSAIDLRDCTLVAGVALVLGDLWSIEPTFAALGLGVALIAAAILWPR